MDRARLRAAPLALVVAAWAVLAVPVEPTARASPGAAPAPGTCPRPPATALALLGPAPPAGATPTAVELCGYSGGRPLKGRPPSGVTLPAGAASALWLVLANLPPASSSEERCRDVVPSVVMQFRFRGRPDVDAALVGFGCPPGGRSMMAPTPVVFFGTAVRSVDQALGAALVASAGSYGVAPSPAVPDLVGEALPEAARTARAAHFAVGFAGEEVERSVAPWVVLVQFPPPGTGDIGNQVGVLVSVPPSPRCKASDLAFGYGGSQGATGNFVAAFWLRDVSGRLCLLEGPLELAGTDSAGRTVTSGVTFYPPPEAVLSARAPAPAPGHNLPDGVVVAGLSVASPDAANCPSRPTQPARWRLQLGGGALFTTNGATGPVGGPFSACQGRLLRFGALQIY